MLDISITKTGKGISLVSLRGRFDGLGAQLFEQEVESSLRDDKNGVLDFSGVTYLSSAGIRSLIKYGKKLKALQGKLILAGLIPDVKWVLETTGMLNVFPQADDVEQALALLDRQQVIDQRTAATFTAMGREWRFTATESSAFLDLWNSSGDLTSKLIAASMDDLSPAFGFGALGSTGEGIAESFGPFVCLDHLAGVLPADGYNHPDFMLSSQAREQLVHVGLAAGLTGKPAFIVDVAGGSPVKLQDAIKEALSRIAAETGNTSPVGLVILAKTETVKGFCYRQYEDLLEDRKTIRELAGPCTVMMVGLFAKDGWRSEPGLEVLSQNMSVRSGQEFLLGNGFVISGEADWTGINDPAEAARACTSLDVLEDVLAVDGNTEITEARIWLYTPLTVRSGEEKLLQIEVTDGMKLPEEWEIITRRLYSDARRVVLEPLTGGFSGSKPFRVVAYDEQNRRMLPTVVKIGQTRSIDKEIINHQKFVHGYILNNSTTIMGTSTVGEYTGMRYNFVGIGGPESSLNWLTNHFRQRPAEELIPLFNNVFTHVLKPWYGQPCWEKIYPYRDHNPIGNFPDLFESAQTMGIPSEQEYIDCPELGRTLPNPYHFLRYEYPARESISQLWYTGINHGDLNMQNILLDDRENVYIIDFSDTRPRNIVSDFARLEPIFKFEMTRLETDQDFTDMLEFEQALASIDSMDEVPPFVYKGSDPSVQKAYQMICQIRKYARQVIIFETDIIPYLLAMLEWTYPVIIYQQLTPFGKKMAAYSAALIVEQIKRIESKQVSQG
ncbi:MAG: STAS domain-containing protein [Chitinophagales bacterium]